ncbi:MAG: TPM domain-containing protein [bacterium]|nr:TPM domain-containing protein [bacterium]
MSGLSFLSFFKKRFFSKKEEKLIVDAIRAAELGTSGEIRVHFSKSIDNDVMTDAQAIFTKLKMHETERRNGVLIYIVPSKKQFAILGDTGFHQIAGDDFWNTVKTLMLGYFKEGLFAIGIVKGIEEVGRILKPHFPRESNDINELNDEISYGE